MLRIPPLAYVASNVIVGGDGVVVATSGFGCSLVSPSNIYGLQGKVLSFDSMLV